ncbi:TPA: nicotinamide mononucleotide transporter [Streptococcus pneumoniae]|uniref:nicotinamide mononucleotide transporter n=1 Tax=Streptococcus pneumoniae TaxID=1313 RepID=UPI0022F2CDF8|nr:nicotinamide mononucleotide transporter [Streptococcus pneumoniae]
MKKSLKIFATSKWFDLFGVALVVGIAIASGYLNSRLDKFVDWGSWTALVPFGLISVTNVGISMLSTRFTGKLSKWGNYFGIVNTILFGAIDYILGNKAAIITYPVTFLFAFVTNYIGYEGKMDLLAYVTTIAFALSLIANALNALKLTTQWGFWLIYNFVQLTKAGIQGNFANIGKYIFYILNAIGALFVWNDEEVRYIEGNSNKEY